MTTLTATENPVTTTSTAEAAPAPAPAANVIGGEAKVVAEGNPAEEKVAKVESQEPTEKKADGAPDTYEFKAAEGQTHDPSVIGPFSEVAKELNLSQDAAQKILDKMTPALAAQAESRRAAMTAEWEGSAKADKEFGGAKFDENMAVAKTALKQFGSPEFVKLLNDSGLGNHPEVIRVMYRAGKAISEDTFVIGGQSAVGKAQPRSQNDYANALYPSKH